MPRPQSRLGDPAQALPASLPGLVLASQQRGNAAAGEKAEEDVQEEGSSGREREQERERGRRASADMAGHVTEVRPSGDNGGRIKASPLARRIARERGIELSAVAGTGPEGRVVAEDVERAAASGGAPVPVTALPTAPADEVEVEQFTSMRRTIARRLTEAW